MAAVLLIADLVACAPAQQLKRLSKEDCSQIFNAAKLTLPEQWVANMDYLVAVDCLDSSKSLDKAGMAQ